MCAIHIGTKYSITKSVTTTDEQRNRNNDSTEQHNCQNVVMAGMEKN